MNQSEVMVVILVDGQELTRLDPTKMTDEELLSAIRSVQEFDEEEYLSE